MNNDRPPKRLLPTPPDTNILQDPEMPASQSDPRPEPGTTFKDLGLSDSLCEACDSLGYKTPTPIQAQSIPHALQGRDIIGLAETGSGKTAAFVLPILQALLTKPQPLHSLIIAPTRELAQQISRAVEALGAVASVRCALLIGGVDMMAQAISLGKKPHVVVATPGRLLDHLENTKGFSLRQLKYLVLDEADRLLDLDFGPVIDKVLKTLPKRTTFLFSATLSSKLESLQRAALTWIRTRAEDPCRQLLECVMNYHKRPGSGVLASDDSVPWGLASNATRKSARIETLNSTPSR